MQMMQGVLPTMGASLALFASEPSTDAGCGCSAAPFVSLRAVLLIVAKKKHATHNLELPEKESDAVFTFACRTVCSALCQNLQQSSAAEQQNKPNQHNEKYERRRNQSAGLESSALVSR